MLYGPDGTPLTPTADVSLDASGALGPSLPTALQWHAWLSHWAPTLKDSEGWVQFLVDAAININQAMVRTSRILRKKAAWEDRGWTSAEWSPVEADADAGLAWHHDETRGHLEHEPSLADRLPAFVDRSIRGGDDLGVFLAVPAFLLH